jgi:pilus assembly protein CpaB
MSIRKVFLGLGVFLMLAGLVMTVTLLNQTQPPPVGVETVKREGPPLRSSILVATRTIPMGTLLRPSDVGWKETLQTNVRQGYFVQGEVPETDYMGAITRRDLANGEALSANDVLKVNDQRFMAATLSRGSRAVSLPFEGAQSQTGLSSASALVLPGDHVDIILTQNFDAAGDPGRRLVGETILRDLRVIAVDRTFGITPKPASEDAKPNPNRGEGNVAPKTVTLEASERQAQELFVSIQLGKIHLSVRPVAEPALSDMDGKRVISSTRAIDVSPALRELLPKAPPATASGLEGSIRYAPASAH